MKTPDIVKINKDVEPLLLASAKCGIHTRGKEDVGKLFTLLACADPHGDRERFERFIDYLNYYSLFDCGICLGDIAPICFRDEDGEWYKNLAKKANKDFHTVLGNHDLGNSKKGEISATTKMAFLRFIKPLEEKAGVSDLQNPYYVKFYDKYNIALIVLNSYDTPDDLDENGDYRVSRGCEMFSEKQTTWFIDTLKNIPLGYHLILAAHTLPYELDKVDCNFTQKSRNTPCPTTATYGNDYMIADIVDAWKRGKKLEKEYAPIQSTDLLPKIKVKCDFEARGTGEFCCYILGHEHADIVAAPTPYHDQTAIFFGSLANDLWQNGGCDLPRTVGTKCEDLITSLTIDTKNKTIRLVRIGSDFSVDMYERKHLSLNY